MSPKRKLNRRKTSSSGSCHPDIPLDLIRNILLRLPVKTLLRFSYVCKAWRELISDSRFIYEHLDRSPASLLLYAVATRINVGGLNRQPQTRCRTLDLMPQNHIFSLYEVPNPQRKMRSNLVRVLEYPGSNVPCFRFLDVMGSPNGIVCVIEVPMAEDFTLWNPATRISKHISHPTLITYPVSSGLGFDPSSNEYKIVRIVGYENKRDFPDRAEVYSLKSGRWRPVKIGDFEVFKEKCEVVVKGVPYWRATGYDKHGKRFLLVHFDVQREVFEALPVPWTMNQMEACMGQIKGCLGMMVWRRGSEMSRDRVIDVWMMGDGGGWCRIYRVGPMLVVGKVMGFYGDRGIVQEVGNGGNLLMYDLENMRVEDYINVPYARPGTFVLINYRESMVDIPGHER